MTHTAIIQFAPIDTLERIKDPNWRPDRQMYERRSLRFKPSQTSVPLLADHDPGRVIGTVHDLFPMEWPNGWWYMARATLEPNAPSWVARGQTCSFGMRVLHRRSYPSFGIDRKVVASALVDEISVLSPGTKPAEPGAHVLFVREEEPAPTRAPERAAGEVIVHREPPPPALRQDDAWMAEVHRRMDWAERRTGRPVDMGDVIKGMNRDINGPTIHELYAETIGRRVAA